MIMNETQFSDVVLEMTFKKQLRLYLDTRGMSGSTLARAAKVPKQSISDWLSGTNPRDVRQVKKVADSLKVSIDHLMFGTGIEEAEAASDSKPNLTTLIGDEWITGRFEIKLRRLK